MTDGYYCSLCNKYFHIKSKNRHIKSFHSNTNSNTNSNSNINSNKQQSSLGRPSVLDIQSSEAVIIPNLYYETELNYLKKRNQDLESIITKFNIETNKFITDYRNKINLHYDEIIRNKINLHYDEIMESQDQEEINTMTSSTDTVCPTETSNSTFGGLRSVTKDRPLV